MQLYLLAADFWVSSGMPSKALPWINRLLNQPKSELRIDLQCYARILNLIIHFDLGNFDVVEYKVNSAHRFIFKRDRMYRFERRVLKFLKHAAGIYDQDLILEAFQKLK